MHEVGKVGEFYKVVGPDYRAYHGADPFSYKGSVGWELYEDKPQSSPYLTCVAGILHAWSDLVKACIFAENTHGRWYPRSSGAYPHLFLVEGRPVVQEFPPTGTKFGFLRYTVVKEFTAKDKAEFGERLRQDCIWVNQSDVNYYFRIFGF